MFRPNTTSSYQINHVRLQELPQVAIRQVKNAAQVYEANANNREVIFCYI
jgi:hypothetical protein